MMEEYAHTQLPIVSRAIMPFGKYKGRRIIDLPEPYLVWYKQKGFPKGKLGDQLALVLEIKANGLENVFKQYR